MVAAAADAELQLDKFVTRPRSCRLAGADALCSLVQMSCRSHAIALVALLSRQVVSG